jgi:hypothetical protein
MGLLFPILSDAHHTLAVLNSISEFPIFFTMLEEDRAKTTCLVTLVAMSAMHFDGSMLESPLFFQDRRG